MNCKDFEPFIFTYAELSSEEKQSLDAHLQQCASCRELFVEVNQLHTAINLVAAEPPQPAHAAKLTQQIMTKVHTSSGNQWLKFIEIFLQNRVMKYSLSAASCALLLIFFTEIFSDAATIHEPFRQSQEGKVVLRAQSFREGFMKRKNASSPDECRAPFKTMSYTLNCMKNKLK